jgi:hypothetical protein
VEEGMVEFSGGGPFVVLHLRRMASNSGFSTGHLLPVERANPSAQIQHGIDNLVVQIRFEPRVALPTPASILVFKTLHDLSDDR